MKDTDNFDAQILGAFVDGEVDAANREAIIQAMETDAGLRERIYRLRRSRDLMQLGFGNVTPASGRTHHRSWFMFSSRLAASIAALAISFSAGFLGHHFLSGTSAPVIASVNQQLNDKLILHVSQSDPRLFEKALDYTERFLRENTIDGSEIEVVAHANGLDLLREDMSPLRERVNSLIQRYDKVHFIACANAIRQLRARGMEPPIIQGVHTGSTAFDHIVNRLQSGEWKYIKVESLPET